MSRSDAEVLDDIAAAITSIRSHLQHGPLSVEIVKVAWPLLRVPVPSVVVPSRKVTVPVGVPVPDVGMTVAVKVTDWFRLDGLTELTTVIVVPVLTTSLKTVDVLPAKLVSPA